MTQSFDAAIPFGNKWTIEFDVSQMAASSIMRIVTIFICEQAIYSIWKP